MADSSLRNVRNQPEPTFSHCSPYGNKTTLSFVLETVAGVMTFGTKTTALVTGDVAVLGVLPGGMKLNDAMFMISAAFTTSTVLDVGFRYCDGVDDAGVPQSVDYFADAIVGATAARLRSVSPDELVTLPKDAFLIVTLVGATQAATSRLEVLVDGVLTGKDE